MAGIPVLRLAAANVNRPNDSSNVYCCLEFTNCLIYTLHAKSRRTKQSMVAIINERGINTELTGPQLKPILKQAEEFRGSLEDRLQSKGRQLSSTLSRLTKKRRMSLLNKTSIIDVKMRDIVPIHEVAADVERLRIELEERDAVIEEMSRKIYNFEELENKGKGLDEVGDRQRRRKIMSIKEASKKAMWFLDSFNVDITSIDLQTRSTSESIHLKFGNTSNNCSQESQETLPSTCSTSTASYSPRASVTVDEVLFLLDTFAVSDEFYHELSMFHQSLPRSYLIKERRKQISTNVVTHRLPYPYYGCYRSVADYMIEVLSNMVDDITSVSTPLIVKLSGDGAPFHRSSTYVLLSFSFPIIDEKSLSAAGNHTFAAISGCEDYSRLQNGLAPALAQVNSLIDSATLILNDTEIKLSFVLGGDFKFLLMSMGMNAANSNYACIYCPIHKDERYDTTLSHPQRTFDSLLQCSSKKQFGVINRPLFHIEPDQIIIDELHLLLRISDVLIRNIIKAAMAADSHVVKDSQHHIENLLQSIRRCGITFRIWKSKDFEWTSLRGNDRKKLLLKLPPSIPTIIPGDNGIKVMTLWNDFNTIYAYISKLEPTTEDIDQCERMSYQWINNFLNIKLDGHSKRNVTPYMHIMCKHVPHQMRKFNGIKRFSGQGVERNNDVARRNYFSSNHMNAPKEVIVTEARLEKLNNWRREKRPYYKQKEEYWSQAIFTKRQKREE